MTEIAPEEKKRLEQDLWACGRCSQEFPSVFKDRQATKLVEKVGNPSGEIDARAILCAMREREMVDKASDYLQSYPGATVIDLGCGFHTYFPLIDNGIIEWCNVDTAAVIAARKELFEDDFRIKQITAEGADTSWIEQISYDRNEGLYVIASGFAESHDPATVKALIAALADRFGDAGFAVDLTAAPFNGMATGALQLSQAGDAATAVAAWSDKLGDLKVQSDYPGYVKEEKAIVRKVRSQVKSALKKGALIIVEGRFA